MRHQSSVKKKKAEKPPQAESALEAFAMKEPLSPEGEALWDEVMAQIERERNDPVLNQPRKVFWDETSE